MTLQTSGPISLLDIRCEMKGSPPDSIYSYSPCIGITAGSTASLCHFYGKTKPLALGDFKSGGYYVGVYGGYYLIAAPCATGVASCCWGAATNAGCGATNLDNGCYNTRTVLNSSAFPAAYFTATRSINGYSDWYMPAENEMYAIHANSASIPAISAYGCFSSKDYWTSNRGDVCDMACIIKGYNGQSAMTFKNSQNFVGAIRRTTTLV